MGLTLGLIGCGGIGNVRAEAISRTPGMRLVSVSDLDTPRAASLAKTYGATVAANWLELVRRSDLDAVVVSTPPSMLAEIAAEAMRQGKHVLCEKPVARNVEECLQLTQVAKDTRRFLATGFNYRFYPSVEKARTLLDSGIIGELDHIRSYTGYSAKDHTHAWLHDAAVMGGGSFRDNGVHLIDLTTYFLGDVVEIQGCASNHVWTFPGCEDNGFALIRNAKGRIASLHASWTEWRRYAFEVELYGSRGCIRISCFPMITEVVWASERGGKTQKKKHWFPMVHVMEHLRSYRWLVMKSFIREFEEFDRAVRGQPSAVATGEDALLTLRIAERAESDLQSSPEKSLAINR